MNHSRHPRAGRPICVAALLAAALGLLASSLRADEIAAARATADALSADRFEDLAAWCEKQQLQSEAEQTRRWSIKRDPLKVYAFEVPASLVAPADLSGDRAKWWDNFVVLRQAKADTLVALAGRALNAHQPRVAYELLVEALRENPDQEQARAILGYQRYGDLWQTAFAAARTKAGQVWHEKYGWLPAAQVARYEQGSRYHNGRWVSAEEDARLHQDIKNGWQIETEHYAITTNCSLEEGVALSRRLERLYSIWQQVFPTYAMTEAELSKLFQNPAGPRRSRKQHNVIYFRNREEYNAWFADEPQIAMSLGIYRFDKKAAYFFAGKDQEPGTVDHEATHQLFWETRPVAPDVGAKNNFWAVEAVAVFMESLVEHDGYYTLGGLQEGRVPAAYQRLVKDNFYVPLAELTAMGMKTLQRDPRLPKIYSQSAGLAWFLMSGQDGGLRDLFTTYLQAIYSGRADDGTLAKLTGETYSNLDRSYEEFMKQR
jgi:hypothetical protein